MAAMWKKIVFIVCSTKASPLTLDTAYDPLATSFVQMYSTPRIPLVDPQPSAPEVNLDASQELGEVIENQVDKVHEQEVGPMSPRRRFLTLFFPLWYPCSKIKTTQRSVEIVDK